MRITHLLFFILFLTTVRSGAQCPAGTSPTTLNLVVNGDFSAGNTGFSSSYINCQDSLCLITSPGGGAGYYGVGKNAKYFHPNFVGTDHTGNGSFMVINGASTAGVSVWCETINISPNTQYLFSTWVTSVNQQSPAKLTFSIDGVQIGAQFNAPGGIFYNTWKEFNATWNSGANTVATICIVNENTAANGNDFGLDDITFSPCACSFTSSVSTPSTICPGSSATLTAQSGATSYTWLPSTGLNTSTGQTVIASPVVNTTYVLIATLNNCSDTVVAGISVYPPVITRVAPDTILCPGLIYRLSATGGVNYSWSPSTGLSNPAIDSPAATVANTITYTVTVTDAHSCTTKDSVVIIAYPRAFAHAGNDTAYCFGKSVQLNASGGVQYLWVPADGLSSDTISNPFASGDTTIDYILKVTDTNGCWDKDFITVTVFPKVSASAGSDISLCGGASANLNGSGGKSYSWSPATGLSSATSSNPTVNIANTTTYTLTVTDSNRCTASDTVIVSVFPAFTINAAPDTSICMGKSVSLNVTPGTGYNWFPAGTLDNSKLKNPTATPLISTTYTVMVTNSNNCSATAEAVVQVYPNPLVNISPDTLICMNDPLVLTASGGASYQWSGGNIIGSNNQGSINVGTTSSSRYTVVVSSAQGCPVSDTVTVVVNPTCSFVVVPDAFTPNNDGLNDFFRPKGKGITKIEYDIYDRWGTKVYTGYDLNSGWNGTYNGKEQPLGVYSWKLDATFEDGRTVKDKGNVTLIR